MNQKAQKNLHVVDSSAPWVQTELGEVVRFRSGGTPDMSNPAYWGGDVPWLSAKDLKNFWLSESQIKLSRQGAKSGTRLAQPGTVLILVRGMTLLKDVPIGVATKAITFNQDIKALEPIDGVDGAFLALHLLNEKQRLMGLVTHAGHGTGRLSTDILESFPLLLPPLEEQRRISALLTVWDHAIDLTGRLIAAKRRRKQALMQQLLTGKRRFKEFRRQKWLSRPLASLGRIASGGTPETGDPVNWDGPHAWVTPTEVSALTSRHILTTKRQVSDHAIAKGSCELLPPGSLIVCTRATVGGCAINAVPMATNQGFKSIIPNKSANVDFLYYAVRAAEVHLKRLAGGSTFSEVSKRDFARLTLPVPSPQEQRRIADTLDCCDREITELRLRLDALKRQKKGLMQRLLTGKTRVISP